MKGRIWVETRYSPTIQQYFEIPSSIYDRLSYNALLFLAERLVSEELIKRYKTPEEEYNDLMDEYYSGYK